jgi:hypothetical protein
MPPSGTPVCLTENTSDMRCAGVVWASNQELAGVIGPYPRPISRPPSTKAQTAGTTHSSRPAAHSSKPDWLTRIAPKRFTAAPAPRLASIAPT